MSILGAKVFQITNSKIGTRKLAPAVSIQSPVQRMGNLEVGFSTSVGTFDVLVDCMSDESNSLEGRSIVLRELERRHGCQRYGKTIYILKDFSRLGQIKTFLCRTLDMFPHLVTLNG